MPRLDRTFTACDVIRFTLRNLDAEEQEFLEYYYELRFYMSKSKYLAQINVILDIVKNALGLILLLWQALLPIPVLKVLLSLIRNLLLAILRVLGLIVELFSFLIEGRVYFILAIAELSDCLPFQRLAISKAMDEFRSELASTSSQVKAIQELIEQLKKKLTPGE